jgi:L-fuconolactonase
MIDSHVHFIDPNRPGGLEWPAAGSPLMRVFMPADFVEACGGRYLDGVVAIETSRRFVDDVWLLDLASREPLIRGVVLNLQPDQSGFDERLALAQSNPKFRGVRLRPIADYDLASDELRKSLAILSASGKTIEFGAHSAALKVRFAKMASEFRESNWILDHAGHPALGRAGPTLDWINSMKPVAEQPNIFVKVTNPYDYAAKGTHPFIEEAFGLLAESLENLFGVDRLVFGSNWPVCTQTTSHDSVATLLGKGFKNDCQRDAFLAGNAIRAYSLSYK